MSSDGPGDEESQRPLGEPIVGVWGKRDSNFLDIDTGLSLFTVIPNIYSDLA